MKPNDISAASVVAVMGLAAALSPVEAQIVSHATGTIDLEMFTYLNEDPELPVTVTESAPIGLANESRSIDMSNYGYTEGISELDYGYSSSGPAFARFDFHTNTEPIPGPSSASATLILDLTIAAPVKYRLDAEIDHGWLGRYSVTFNSIAGTANWDELTAAGGTFPLVYSGDAAYGWYPYVDEGVLPAGQHQLSIETSSHSGRYLDPGHFAGTASLTLQLLGDVNLDGFVVTVHANRWTGWPAVCWAMACTR